ncbi:MAG: ADP-forming succinate--CoA ligase subunit beta [Desulfohalobiaceae bacterium]
MKIHEYQAKEIFRQYEVPVPRGKPAFSLQEAEQAAQELETLPVVLKAQIHAGGRGKAGGVQLAHSVQEVRDVAEKLLNMRLVTPQTGEQGRQVSRILVEEGLGIEKELYLGLLPDRNSGQNVIMASEAGGMDIEEVAEKTPEKIIKVFVSPLLGLQAFHCRKIAFGLNLPAAARKALLQILPRLYRLYTALDCSLVEINPLVVDNQERVLALDAKLSFDSNALFKHQELLEYRDLEEEEPLEVEASRYGLNYIKMQGNVGNMVNGAGLAMATMDIIKQAGAEPANFLDVGGGASTEMVENGFRIILGDENVQVILINIFGGILRCDVLARGVVQAAGQVGLNVPVVVRMEGTNVEEGRKILAESGLDLRTARDLEDAASQVARIAG